MANPTPAVETPQAAEVVVIETPTGLAVVPEGVRPEGLPAGFNSWGELAAAYEIIRPPEAPAATPSAPAVVAPKAGALPQIVPAADATKAITDAGLDLDALSREVATNGELSKESLEALKAKGVDQFADAFVSGQQAEAEVAVTKMAEVVGGKDAMDALFKWASTGITSAEAQAFNSVLATRNEAAIGLALSGLAARMEKSVGSLPAFVNGAAVRTSNEKPFESVEELLDAQRDKRYGRDPAYMEKIARRLASSRDDLLHVEYS